MKKSKKNVMMNNDTPIRVYVNNTQIENVETYINLGRGTAPEQRSRRFKEESRPDRLGNIGTCLKRQAYTSCLLPEMTYGAETWALIKQAKNKLAATQTKMERSMVNITYRDRKTNIWEIEKAKVTQVTFASQ